MRGATAPRLLLELICARVLLPGADDSTDGLMARLDRLERRGRLDHGGRPPPSPVPPAPARGPRAAPPAGRGLAARPRPSRPPPP